MKLREFLRKIRRRSPQFAGDSVDSKFTESFEKGASTWMPSQQDRPRH